MSMVSRAPLTGGRLAGLGEFSASGVVNTLSTPGVWLCDKAAQNDLNICGTTGVTKYMPYALSLLVYGAGAFLVMKAVRKGR